MKKISNALKNEMMELLQPYAAESDAELIDIETVTENGKSILRLIIDRRGGVTIEQCARVSELCDGVIEKKYGFADYDSFEVSSPGLERPLKTLADCVRHRDEDVNLSLYQNIDGRKRFQGKLCVEGEKVGVVEGDRTFLFEFSSIAHIERDLKFDFAEEKKRK